MIKDKYGATLDDPSPYGIRFSVKIPMVGLNGLRGILMTKWQINNNKSIPRLITNWLKVIQENVKTY